MSLPRLTFLYPHLFKPARICEPGFGLKPLRAGPEHVRRGAKAGFSSTRRQRQETYAQRYGSAAEPPPPSEIPSKSSEDKTLAGAIEKEVNPPPIQEEKKPDRPESKAEKPAAEPKKATEMRLDDAIATTLQDPSERAIDLVAAQSSSKEETESSPKEAQGTRATHPLATVLEMPAPAVDTPEQHRGPHMQAPPYVHHFDTFTLVKNLETGGFTEDQSVTIMKAVRSLLALNLDFAREGLVSKSDVENVNAPLIPPGSHHFTNSPLPAGNIPLPRRLLRTPHRDPQRPQSLLHKTAHPTLPPPTHLRHSLPARLPRIPRFEGRSQGHAQRPPDGRTHAATVPRRRNIGVEL